MTPALALLLVLPGQHPDWRPDPDRDLGQFRVSAAAAYECQLFAAEHCEFVEQLVAINQQAVWWNADRPFWFHYGREAHRRKDIWKTYWYTVNTENGRFAREVWVVYLYEQLGPADFWQGRLPAPAPMMDDIWR